MAFSASIDDPVDSSPLSYVRAVAINNLSPSSNVIWIKDGIVLSWFSGGWRRKVVVLTVSGFCLVFDLVEYAGGESRFWSLLLLSIMEIQQVLHFVTCTV